MVAFSAYPGTTTTNEPFVMLTKKPLKSILKTSSTRKKTDRLAKFKNTNRSLGLKFASDDPAAEEEEGELLQEDDSLKYKYRRCVSFSSFSRWDTTSCCSSPTLPQASNAAIASSTADTSTSITSSQSMPIKPPRPASSPLNSPVSSSSSGGGTGGCGRPLRNVSWKSQGGGGKALFRSQNNPFLKSFDQIPNKPTRSRMAPPCKPRRVRSHENLFQHTIDAFLNQASDHHKKLEKQLQQQGQHQGQHAANKCSCSCSCSLPEDVEEVESSLLSMQNFLVALHNVPNSQKLLRKHMVEAVLVKERRQYEEQRQNVANLLEMSFSSDEEEEEEDCYTEEEEEEDDDDCSVNSTESSTVDSEDEEEPQQDQENHVDKANSHQQELPVLSFLRTTLDECFDDDHDDSFNGGVTF